MEAFLYVVKRKNLTLNHAKYVISASCINVLGYLVQDGLRPLKELPVPSNVQSLRINVWLYAYYDEGILEFSSKMKFLMNAKEVPQGNSNPWNDGAYISKDLSIHYLKLHTCFLLLINNFACNHSATLFPCSNITSITVMKCFDSMFVL